METELAIPVIKGQKIERGEKFAALFAHIPLKPL